MYVTVRNDGARDGADASILAGMIYTYDNLTRLIRTILNSADRPGDGSQSNLLFTSAETWR